MDYQKIIEKFGEGRIGDVIKKVLKNFVEDDKKIRMLLAVWIPCDLSKSLQDILRDEAIKCECNCFCNFSNEHKHFSMRKCEHCDGKGEKNNLSQPAQELFNFLETL